MKKRIGKKLSLSKETLRNLSEHELGNVFGGAGTATRTCCSGGASSCCTDDCSSACTTPLAPLVISSRQPRSRSIALPPPKKLFLPRVQLRLTTSYPSFLPSWPNNPWKVLPGRKKASVGVKAHFIRRTTMSVALVCPKCGASLSAKSPQGHCPACLLKAGLESSSVSETPASAVSLSWVSAITPAL